MPFRPLLFLILLCWGGSKLVAQASSDTTGLPSVKQVLYGKVSFYSNKFHGCRTASGEIFDQRKFTCASNTFSFGTWLKITNLNNGRSVIVKVNDRLHPKMKRIADLTRAAAERIGIIAAGVGKVKVEILGKHPPRQPS